MPMLKQSYLKALNELNISAIQNGKIRVKYLNPITLREVNKYFKQIL